MRSLLMPPSSMLDGIPEQLWYRVQRARGCVLMLDFDGTIAPLHARRGAAAAPAQTRELLEQVRDSGSTRLAVVSGRPVHDLAARLPGLGVALFGVHGTEWLQPDGRKAHAPLEEHARRLLARAYASALTWADSSRIERKRGAIVLHTRDLPTDERAALHDACASAWGRLTSDRALRLDLGEGSAELRVRVPDKGTVVRTLHADSSPGVLGVFVGDDLTDEDGFAAVGEWGFGVRVGPPGASTLAQAWLPGSEAMPEFLERWLDATRH
jgi:trehalose 6-phosphate phosphatase